MLTTLTDVTLLVGGIGWNPGLRGLLSVLLGTVILCGSVWLIVATNTGARLGMLIALAGLSGWMVILSLYWTIAPPAIGPTGPVPSWEPVEIIYNTPDVSPATESVASLPTPEQVAEIRNAILEGDAELSESFATTPSLTDIAAENEELVTDLDLGGWRVVPASDAGEAQAAADEILVAQGLFESPSDYKKLDVFVFGGKPEREDVPDDEWYEETWTRIRHKVETTVWWKHPTKYAVVQIQPVVAQETRPGEAPPTPEVDPEQPVISVVMVRDLGNQRGLPALYLIISTAFFVIFSLMLHFRDKTLDKNLAAAEAAKKG